MEFASGGLFCFLLFFQVSFYKVSVYNTMTEVRSVESRATDTTKTFTGESSLTGAIIQTWAATTRILLKKERIRKKKVGMWMNELNGKANKLLLLLLLSSSSSSSSPPPPSSSSSLLLLLLLLLVLEIGRLIVVFGNNTACIIFQNCPKYHEPLRRVIFGQF